MEYTVVGLLLLVGVVTADFYTSVESVKPAIVSEKQLVKEWRQLLQEKDENVRLLLKNEWFNNEIYRILEDAELQYDELNRNDKLHYHPIVIYKLVYRTIVRWDKISDHIKQNSFLSADFVSRFVDLNKRSGWPTAEDFVGTGLALIRLKDTYQLDLNAFLAGRVVDLKTTPLTEDEILNVGQIAIDDGQNYQAVLWLDVLGKRNITAETRTKIEKLTELINDKCDLCRTSSLDGDFNILSLANKSDDVIAHHELCRGEIRKTPDELSKLYCYYKQTDVPYRLAPVEILHRNPDVVVFHKAIGEQESEAMKEIVRATMTRSACTEDDPVERAKLDKIVPHMTRERISNTGWLFDQQSPVINTLSKRIELISGLSTTLKTIYSHAEPYQLINYGIGGRYYLHHDYFVPEDLTGEDSYIGEHLRYSGNRMATMIFYLSKVEGGATVFPRLNVTALPEPGSALLFFNMKRNGELDEDSYHAGCPVLLGNKWVATKMMHSIGQTFRRKCAMDPQL